MQQLRQYIYWFEFILVAIPATFFLFLTIFLLAGLAGSNPGFSLQLFVLWIGGCMGVYALWSMFVRLLNNKLVNSVRELPLLSLACGMVANAVPVFYFFLIVTKPEQLAFALFCISPAIVALHWTFALMNTNSLQRAH